MTKGLVLGALFLAAACGPRVPVAAGAEKAAPASSATPAPVPTTRPLSRSLKLMAPTDAGYDAVLAAVRREKLPVSAASKDGGIVHTDFVAGDGEADPDHHRVRFDIQISAGLVLVRAEPQERAGSDWKAATTLDDAEWATMNRLAGDLQASLAAIAGEGYAPKGAETPPPPDTPWAAALAAIQDAGLTVERSLEAAGVIETSWHDEEMSHISYPGIEIHYRVRYVVQVSGDDASARMEIQKSTDERSWLQRAEPTKAEQKKFDELRRALHARMDAIRK